MCSIIESPTPRTVPAKRLTRRCRPERGAATAELALCLPVIVLVAFGSVEGASMIFLKQMLVQSAYEGAKVAIQRKSTNEEIATATRAVLVGRSLTNVTVETNPINVESARRGDLVVIRVSAPSDANSLFPFGVFSSQRITGTAVMVKE